VVYDTLWNGCILHHGMVNQRCIIQSGNYFIIKYLVEYSAKIEIVPEYREWDQEYREWSIAKEKIKERMVLEKNLFS